MTTGSLEKYQQLLSENGLPLSDNPWEATASEHGFLPETAGVPNVEMERRTEATTCETSRVMFQGEKKPAGKEEEQRRAKNYPPIPVVPTIASYPDSHVNPQMKYLSSRMDKMERENDMFKAKEEEFMQRTEGVEKNAGRQS